MPKSRKPCRYNVGEGGCQNPQCKFLHVASNHSNIVQCIPQLCIGPTCRFYHQDTNWYEDENYQIHQGTKRPHTDNGYGEKRARTEFDIEEIVLVPDKYVGLLLGTKHVTINRIQERCEADIHVTKPGELVEGDKRKVTITGSQEQVDAAKREYNSILTINDVNDFSGFKVDQKRRNGSRISRDKDLNLPSTSQLYDREPNLSNSQICERSSEYYATRKSYNVSFDDFDNFEESRHAYDDDQAVEQGPKDTISNLQDKVERNKQHKLSNKATLKKLVKENKSLEGRCESQQKQIEILTRKIAESDSLKQCALQETDQLTTDLTNLKAQHEGDVVHLKAEKSDLVNRLEQSIGDLEKDNERAKTELKQSKADFQMHKKTCSSIEAERDNLAKELMNLQKKFLAMNDQLEESKRKENMDVEVLTALEQDVHSKELRLQSQDSNVQRKEEIISGLESDIKQLKTDKDEQSVEIETKDQAIRNLEKEVGHLRSIKSPRDNENTKKDIVSQNQITSLLNTNKELTSSKDVKATEMDQLQAELGKNCQHLDEAKNEIKAREQKIQKHLATIEALKISANLASQKRTDNLTRKLKLKEQLVKIKEEEIKMLKLTQNSNSDHE